MKFIHEAANGKFEAYHLYADGTASKFFTAKTREAAVAKIELMGVSVSPAPEKFTVRKPEAAPRLGTFAQKLGG